MCRDLQQNRGQRIEWLLSLLLFVSGATVPAWIYSLFLSASRNTPTLPLALLIVLGVNGVLTRQVVRHQPELSRLIGAGFLFKTLAIASFVIVLLVVYGGGDALLYHRNAVVAASHFWEFGQFPKVFTSSGTKFVSAFTGATYVLLGSSFSSGMLFFGSLAFWGCYFYLRAFQNSFPARDLSVTALMLFFFPSLVFWTASIGKDAIVLLFSGLFAFGASRLLTGNLWKGSLLIALGLIGTSFVRPHIALMLLLAAIVSLTFSRSLPLLSQNLTRALGVLIFIPAVIFLIPFVQGYIGLEELSLGSSVDYLEQRLTATTGGGSSFGAAPFVQRLLFAPLLLIRPLPWEAHNLTSAIAAAEGLVFLATLVAFRRNLFANLRRVRRNPLLLFILLFVVEFLIVFSSIGNFGILARQRVMVFPLLFLFISAPAESAEQFELNPQANGDLPDPRAEPALPSSKEISQDQRLGS